MNACPLTSVYLQSVYSHVKDLPAGLYADTADEVSELLQRARQAGGAETLQRLRAFYLIELLYSRVVHKTLRQDLIGRKYPEGIEEVLNELGFHQYDRSWEGLGDLLKKLDFVEETLVLEYSEMAFMSNGPGSVSHFLQERYKRTSELFPIIRKTATVLRSQLREFAGLQSIGKGAVEAMMLANIKPAEMSRHGGILLSVSRRNAMNPWKSNASRDSSSI
jgi:hypothetical protein